MWKVYNPTQAASAIFFIGGVPLFSILTGDRLKSSTLALRLSVMRLESGDRDWENRILGLPLGGVALEASGVPDLLRLIVSWRNLEARVCIEPIASA
jgi:hypothetical protein